MLSIYELNTLLNYIFYNNGELAQMTVYYVNIIDATQKETITDNRDSVLKRLRFDYG